MFKDNVVCVARESVYRFYEKVVDEYIAMYAEAGLTLDEMHAGGDEVAEGAWTNSPMIDDLLKTLPDIKDPKNLQTYFFRRLVKMFEEKNLRIDGWEEVALTKTEEGKYVPNPEFADRDVVPYVWNNLWNSQDLGYRLANFGYNVVLCDVSNFYFDLAYNKDPEEPGLYWAGFCKTRNAWEFAPFDLFKTTYKTAMGRIIDQDKEYKGMERLKPEARKNILGVEAHLWSETIKGRDMIEYYLLPKLFGFVESAWAPERRWETIENRAKRNKAIAEDWNVFANTLAQKELPRLSYINGGYNYRLPLPGAIIEDGMLKANVEFPGLTLRYTTDGSEPNKDSKIYEEPVKVSGTVKIKSFDSSGKSSRASIVTAN
jgi:hexosaminidase